MLAHSCNPSMWQAESGRSCTPGQPELQRGLYMAKQIHYKFRKDTWLYISDCSQSEAGTNTRNFILLPKQMKKWRKEQLKKHAVQETGLGPGQGGTHPSFQRSGGRGMWSPVGSKPAWYVHEFQASQGSILKPVSKTKQNHSDYKKAFLSVFGL